MEVVKFVCSEENNGVIELYFKICDKLADIQRDIYHGEETLNRDNLFCYRICSDNFESVRESVVKTIEKISNENDDVYFLFHLISDNGIPRSPAKIHALMHDEYGLADVKNENTDKRDREVEWVTAHFFTAIQDLFFPYED